MKKVLLFFILLFNIQYVFANVIVTAPTLNICVSSFPSSASSLGNIVITEGFNNDIVASQTDKTLILTVPTNFQFVPNNGSISPVSGDITSISMAVTSNLITITLSTDATANQLDVITISGIQIFATNTPTSGNVSRTVSNPGDLNISGVTNGLTFFASITSTAAPSATIAYNGGSPYCNNVSTAQSVTRTGTAGGTYTASPSGLSINPSTGAVTPNTSAAGAYTVTYTIAALGGCAQFTTTAVVTVTTAPSATIVYNGSPYCSNVSSAQSVTRTGSSGGTYTSSPSGLSINSSTGAITPSASAAGTYTVTYTIAASAGCLQFTTTAGITITAQPNATIEYNSGSPYCSNVSTAQSVTRTGTAGGIYTSLPSGLIINSSTGAVTPSTSTVGTYTVTYTIAASGGCPQFTTTANVIIFAAPTATIEYNGGSPYCINVSTPQSVTRTGASGGTYTSLPSGLSINSTTGAIIPI